MLLCDSANNDSLIQQIVQNSVCLNRNALGFGGILCEDPENYKQQWWQMSPADRRTFKRLVLFQRLGERLQSVLQSSLLRWTLVETSRDHMSRLVHSGEAGILVCLTFNCHWTFSSISPRRIPKFKILVIKVFFFSPLSIPSCWLPPITIMKMLLMNRMVLRLYGTSNLRRPHQNTSFTVRYFNLSHSSIPVDHRSS